MNFHNQLNCAPRRPVLGIPPAREMPGQPLTRKKPMNRLMKFSALFAVALALALLASGGTIFTGCVNCPPSGIVATNTVIQVIGTNVLPSITFTNGAVTISGAFPSNQVLAVEAATGTNCGPIIVNQSPTP